MKGRGKLSTVLEGQGEMRSVRKVLMIMMMMISRERTKEQIETSESGVVDYSTY